MSWAHDIPGYIQGYRMAPDPEFYDPSAAEFIDLAGYGHLGNNLRLNLGTPVFANLGANSRKGLLFDNSCHWQNHLAIPWEGSMLVVFRPTLVSAAVTLNPMVVGSGAVSVSPKWTVSRNSGVNATALVGSSASLSRSISGLTSGSIAIAAWSTSQEDRKFYSTQDGVTVTGTSALAGTTNGVGPAMGSGGGTLERSRYTRWGNNNGTFDDVTPNATDYLHLFETHFWRGDVLNDNPVELAAFIARLKAYYGI